MTDIHDINRRAWDRRARDGKRFTKPVDPHALVDPLKRVDGLGWLSPPDDVAGKRLLALAAGGGKHAALYAAAGAKVTVVDISDAMLDLDRKVAAERGLDITPLRASMDDLSALGDAIFDVVIHPVSTCYLPETRPVYDEVARVTKAGGVYISQHKQPVSMQADVDPLPGAGAGGGYGLIEPYDRCDALPPVSGSLHREEGTVEFLHTWSALLGAMCAAGFVIEALMEPDHRDAKARPGSFEHRSRWVPPYVRVKARRVAGGVPEKTGPALWTPDE